MSIQRYAIFQHVRTGMRELYEEIVEKEKPETFRRVSVWFVKEDAAEVERLTAELTALRERVEKAEKDLAILRAKLGCGLNCACRDCETDVGDVHPCDCPDVGECYRVNQLLSLAKGRYQTIKRVVSERDAATARAERAEEALRQCRTELADFQRLAHGKREFPPTKGTELADAILSGDHSAQPGKMVGERERRLVEALTPSAETKAAYIGEFTFTSETMDEDGEPRTVKQYVPWTTIKEIMKAIRERAAMDEGDKQS